VSEVGCERPRLASQDGRLEHEQRIGGRPEAGANIGWLGHAVGLVELERRSCALSQVFCHRGAGLFPDDRVEPFGSGATVFFDYVDLRFANETDRTLQLRVWLTNVDRRGASGVTVRRRGPTASTKGRDRES
jgi:hypothetical protein